MKFIRIFAVALIMTGAVIGGCESSSPTGYTGTYIGNVNTHEFHKTTCSYLPAPANQTTFNTRQDAINAGYNPCGHCKP
jgi:competence protein ComEC